MFMDIIAVVACIAEFAEVTIVAVLLNWLTLFKDRKVNQLFRQCIPWVSIHFSRLTNSAGIIVFYGPYHANCGW